MDNTTVTLIISGAFFLLGMGVLLLISAWEERGRE